MSKKEMKERMALIRGEYVQLTGHYIPALILNQFVEYSKITRDTDLYIEEESKRMIADGRTANLEKSRGWVYKSLSELNEELMLGLSDTTISKYLKQLIDKGWIEQRQNPKYKWDRTLQYRVDMIRLQVDLWESCCCLIPRSGLPSDLLYDIVNNIEKYKDLNTFPNIGNGEQVIGNGIQEIGDSSSSDWRAIPKDTIEDTYKEKKIPAQKDAAGDIMDNQPSLIPIEPVEKPKRKPTKIYQVFEELEKIQPGINKGQTLKDAKQLLKQGYSVEDIVNCGKGILEDKFWIDKQIPLNTSQIKKRIQNWAKSDRTEYLEDGTAVLILESESNKVLTFDDDEKYTIDENGNKVLNIGDW